VDALVAGAIGHPLMDISAMMADPDRQNSERQTMLAIAKVGVFFGFSGQFSSRKDSKPYASHGAIGCMRVIRGEKDFQIAVEESA
jgi:hypothetical protein